MLPVCRGFGPGFSFQKMIEKALTYALGAEILTRLNDRVNEKEDADAWKLLIAWHYRQQIFSAGQVAEMLGMSIHSLNRRFRRYHRMKSNAT